MRLGVLHIVPFLAALTTAGCSEGEPPRANVSDPAVFTALHITSAEISTASEAAGGGSLEMNGPFTAGHMKRYFEDSEAEYKKGKLRMDDLLDGRQRLSTYLQTIQTRFTLDVAANFAKAMSVAATQPSDDKSGDGKGGDGKGGGDAGHKEPAPAAPPAAAGDPAASDPAAGPAQAGGGSAGGGSAGGGSTGGGDTDRSAKPTTLPSRKAAELKAYGDAFLGMLDELNKTFGNVSPSDSPFDQLDRVADFYAAYVIKSLRVRGDSRTIDPEELADDIIYALKRGVAEARIQASREKDADEQRRRLERADLAATGIQMIEQKVRQAIASQQGQAGGPADSRDERHDRFLLLIFQTHVDPGTRADYMTGVRVRITAADRWADPSDRGRGLRPGSPDDVKVIRLHPTRFYDVDEVNFEETIQRAVDLSADLGATKSGVSAEAKARREASVEAGERRRFLSRISKTASFADATNHEFGFNFYPSNVMVQRVAFFPKLLGYLFGTPREYQTHSHLEGGARDCAALVVVPRDLARFSCEVSSVSAAVDPSRYVEERSGGRQFVVTLPPWHNLEALAATLNAAPTRRQSLGAASDRQAGGGQDGAGPAAPTPPNAVTPAGVMRPAPTRPGLPGPSEGSSAPVPGAVGEPQGRPATGDVNR